VRGLYYKEKENADYADYKKITRMKFENKKLTKREMLGEPAREDFGCL